MDDCTEEEAQKAKSMEEFRRTLSSSFLEVSASSQQVLALFPGPGPAKVALTSWTGQGGVATSASGPHRPELLLHSPQPPCATQCCFAAASKSNDLCVSCLLPACLWGGTLLE